MPSYKYSPPAAEEGMADKISAYVQAQHPNNKVHIASQKTDAGVIVVVELTVDGITEKQMDDLMVELKLNFPTAFPAL